MSKISSYPYKVILVGDGGVGKTSMVNRLVYDKFEANCKMTVGVALWTKQLNWQDQDYVLQIWDLGGQDHFRFMQDTFIRGAMGTLLCFDITRRISFESLEKWLRMVRKESPYTPILLVGTKVDLEDEQMVSDDEAIEFARYNRIITYLKVSSKWGTNIDTIFKLLLNSMVTNYLRDNIIDDQ